MTEVMSQRITEQIKVVVDAHGAIKGVDLAVKVMSNLHPTEIKPIQITEVLHELVEKKELQEVEYILPTIDYRVKSVYFPAGTITKCR